jgi:hypothetical protein
MFYDRPARTLEKYFELALNVAQTAPKPQTQKNIKQAMQELRELEKNGSKPDDVMSRNI